MSTQITIKTFNNQVLNFNVSKYELKEGMIFFYDPITKANRGFPISNCELREVT